MFKKSDKQSSTGNEKQVLTETQLQQLKSAFSDISLSPKDSTVPQQHNLQQSRIKDPQKWQSSLLKTYSRIKNTFYDLNSRAFIKYAQNASHLQIRNQLQTRPQLLKLNLTVNVLQCLSVAICIFIPRKLLNKTLLSMATVTVYFYFLQKLMLNYFIEQIALVNNRMQPIQQQARNLIEYKYRIQNLKPMDSKNQQNQPYIQHLLYQVDRKNLEYLRFKKVQLLI